MSICAATPWLYSTGYFATHLLFTFCCVEPTAVVSLAATDSAAATPYSQITRRCTSHPRLTFCCVEPTAVVSPAATTSAALLVFSPRAPIVFREPSATCNDDEHHICCKEYFPDRM
jgi:hypothetical protein